MVQNLKKVLKSKISKKNSFLRHEVPFKAKNNCEAVVVCAIHEFSEPPSTSSFTSVKNIASIPSIVLINNSVSPSNNVPAYSLQYNMIDQ